MKSRSFWQRTAKDLEVTLEIERLERRRVVEELQEKVQGLTQAVEELSAENARLEDIAEDDELMARRWRMAQSIMNPNHAALAISWDPRDHSQDENAIFERIVKHASTNYDRAERLKRRRELKDLVDRVRDVSAESEPDD